MSDAASLASVPQGGRMTTTTVTPRRSDHLAFIKTHGTAIVVMVGATLWLLPAALAETKHGELLSWAALGVACASGVVLGWQQLEGWRVWAAVAALGVLAAMLVWLLAESAGVLGTVSRPDLSGMTYRDARGDGACSTSSCSGHEAGWHWAERSGIADPDECAGRSRSFEEGCRAYAEELSGVS